MKYLKVFENFNNSNIIIKYKVYFDINDINGEPLEIEYFDENELENANYYYDNTFIYDDGKYKTYTHTKYLEKLTYEIPDDEDYVDVDVDIDVEDLEIIDYDFIKSDEYRINDKSDELLEEVEDWFKKEYNSQKYKYHSITIYDPKNDDEYKDIQIRITDHTENINNNDRYMSYDYYLSIVICDYDVTDSKFGMMNSFERRNNEYELKFNSSDYIEEIKINVKKEIQDIIDEILESF